MQKHSQNYNKYDFEQHVDTSANVKHRNRFLKRFKQKHLRYRLLTLQNK